MAKIQLNGKKISIKPNFTIMDLLIKYKLNKKKIAVEHNGIILPKIKYKKKISSFKIEFDKLWIHGLVHLFGYDHKKEKDFLAMKKIEKEYSSFIND